MFKYAKHCASIAVGMSLFACSSGGNTTSGSGSGGSAITGGVDQPASAAYYSSESDNTLSAMIRLTTASSGVLYINSANSPVTNIKATISSFDKSSATCLAPTAAEGQSAGVSTSFEVSLTNCVFGSNSFSAVVNITKDKAAFYESAAVFHNVEIASYDQVKSLSDALPESNPNLYYVPMANTGNITFNLPVIGMAIGSYGIYGVAFGELMNSFVTTTTTPIQMDFGSADIAYKVIDSTSLMVYLSNIQVDNTLLNKAVAPKAGSSKVAMLASTTQQIECNVIVSGMVVDNQLVPDMHGFLTGCNGVVKTTIGDVTALDGTIAIYGLN